MCKTNHVLSELLYLYIILVKCRQVPLSASLGSAHLEGAGELRFPREAPQPAWLLRHLSHSQERETNLPRGSRESETKVRKKKRPDYFIDMPSIRSYKPCCGCPESREALVMSRCKRDIGSDSKKSWDVLNCSARKWEQFLGSITKLFIASTASIKTVSFHFTVHGLINFSLMGFLPIYMHFNGKRTFPAPTAKTYFFNLPA